MKRIDGRAKTVRELMDRARFAIDFYQREYAWQDRQVRELIEDLTERFIADHKPGEPRSAVRGYGHYFLGAVVVSHKNDKRYIVDGQQRLTTLTLLFIWLHHRRALDAPAMADVQSLVFSSEYGERSFNIDVRERREVTEALLRGDEVNTDGQAESVQNLADRYETIGEVFPVDEIDADALPYFVDWLLNHVHFVEIEAYSDEDAYTIFETMNDRGLSLSLPDMLKGYVLATIDDVHDQRRVNEVWKRHVDEFKALGRDEDVDFFKTWLRARYAETFQAKGGAERNRDYERIGSEFHRWVRDKRETIGITDAPAMVRWVHHDLDFFARQAHRIRRAGQHLTPGLESIRYNEQRSFSQQTQMLLAPLEPADSPDTIDLKLRLVADFLDIWMSRRIWSYRTIAQRNTKAGIFGLTRDLRGRDAEGVSELLRGFLDKQPERFASQPHFRLHKQNKAHVRHILARLTLWLDQQCGLPAHFDDLVSSGRAKRFEIEHIWASHYDRFRDYFDHPVEFGEARNRIGGLLLLQRGLNQSLGDATYEQKRDSYVSKGQNLLARSLHPYAYEHNPAFRQFIERTGLAFKPHERFGPREQQQRQELYIRMAEWVWNPSRLALEGESPPEHLPIGAESPGVEVEKSESPADRERHEARRAFWTALLAHASTRTDAHRNCSPGTASWISGGSGRSGLTFTYVVYQHATRVELYISTGDMALNKSYFEDLEAQRREIAAESGLDIEWQRLDDAKASRICVVLDQGGWRDRDAWPSIIEATVATMVRFRDALRPRVLALQKP